MTTPIQSVRLLEEAIDGRPVSSLQWRVVVLCGLVAIFDGFDIQSIAFAAPAIGTDWGVPREAFGFIFSVGIAGMLLGLLLQGPVADRLGRRPIILASAGVFGLASLCTGFASTMTELILTRLIAGIGMGAALPNVIALTGEYSPARLRSRLIVAMNAGLPIGGFAGGLVCSPLIELFGWRSIFIVGGLGPLILLPLLLVALPESPPFLAASGKPRAGDKLQRLLRQLDIDPSSVALTAAGARPKRAGFSLAHLFREGRARNTILLCLIFFANMLLFYFLIGWLPTLLTQSGLPVGKAVLVSAGLNLGTVAGGLALGWAADKQGARRTLFGTYMGATMLFLLMGGGFGWGFGATALLAALLGLCIGGAQLVLNAIAAELYPLEMRASGVGAAGMAGRFGAIIGPVAGSVLLANGIAMDVLFLLLAVPAVIAGACALAMRAAANLPFGKNSLSTAPSRA